jgi:hypothetical protein
MTTVTIDANLAPYRRWYKPLLYVPLSPEQRASIEAEASRRGASMKVIAHEAIEAALKNPLPSTLQWRGQRRRGRDLSAFFAFNVPIELMARIDAAVGRRGGTRASFVEDAINAVMASTREDRSAA